MLGAADRRVLDVAAAPRDDDADARARAALLAAFSHDLRAPLARIIQYRNMLGTDPGTCKYQDAIEACARQQLELIDDLLEYSRLELATPELVPAPVYLYAMLQQVACEGAALAAGHGGSFALDWEGPIAALALLDGHRLRQILRKLLAHAARVSQRGRFSLRVEALAPAGQEAPAHGSVLRFSISDSGAGIAAADMAGLFQPFLAASAGRAGAILGLALAERLVRAMGAQLRVANLPGGGSRLDFELWAPAAHECDAMAVAPTFSTPPPFGRGWRILLLEANAASADYLEEVLASAQFDVLRVARLDQALALQRDPGRRCPIVLSADNLPAVEPWDLLRCLHGLDPENPPALLLHALRPPRRPPGWPDGLTFAAVLYKPATPQAWFDALRRLTATPGSWPPPAADPFDAGQVGPALHF